MTNARLHLAAVTATATTATLLFASHPPALGRAGAVPLVIAIGWIAVTGAGAWLALTSAAALGAVVGAGRAPSPLARFAPAFVRRMVEVALVGSCIVGSAVPASATSWRTRRDIPVVRAPAAVTTTAPPTTSTRPSPPTTSARPAPPPADEEASPPTTVAPLTTAPVTRPSATTPTVHAAPPRMERARPADAPAHAVTPRASHPYTVQPGDNLWSIARAALGGNADDTQIAPYWRTLIAANRSRLRSGDPNLIYPGEVLGLPDRGANQ